jgi:urease accessory protein
MELIKITERLTTTEQAQATLTLPYELRQKSRLLTKLDSGEEVGLFLPRGQVLRGGDCLRADNGMIIKLNAALESVSTITTVNSILLSKACYHLGNRHMPLQITESWLRYLQDHVLDQMVESLGLSILHEMASFEPEVGAYQHHPHQHD